MNDEYVFKVGSIGLSKCDGRKPSTLLQAARHNRRDIQAELGARGHIDPARSVRNETLAGPDTPAKVVALAKTLMASAGVDVAKLRKDHTQAIEVLFSLPPDTAIDEGDYFRRCVDWAGQHFGKANVLSADIHRDESTPHCHVLVLPLVANKMAGSALKSLKATAAMCESFYSNVAETFGLKKPMGRLVGAARGAAVKAVRQAIEARCDGLLTSALRETVNRLIESDPRPFMAALGISLDRAEPVKKLKTMTQIFTSPGKGAKTLVIEQRRAKAIAFGDGLRNHQSLPCVVFARSAHALRGIDASPAPDADGVPPARSQCVPSRLETARQAVQAGSQRHQRKAVVTTPENGFSRIPDPDFDASEWARSTEAVSIQH